MSRSSRLLGLGAAAAVIVPLTLVAPASVAAPTEADLNPSVAAGEWLADQVVVEGDQGFLESAYSGSPDFGLAADAIYSFGQREEHSEASSLLAAGLEANIDAYIRPALPQGETGTYLDAGRLAKVVLAASTLGKQTNFAGRDVSADLVGTIDEAGRAVNQGGSKQGQTTVFAQTYVLEALAINFAAATDVVARALLDAQCSDGGFPFAFPSQGEACVSDADTTARAVVALDAVGLDGEGHIPVGADEGREWVRAAQSADGSYDPGFGVSVSTTLLAAQALAQGETAADYRAALRAAGFARTLQLDSLTGVGGLANERGAMFFDRATFDAVRSAGTLDEFQRTGAVFAAVQSYGALGILDGGPAFADLRTDAIFYPEITWLASQKVTTGYVNGDGSTSFRGPQAVLREQMAAFLYRFANEGENPPSSSEPSEFIDVPVNHVFKSHIAWLAEFGITTGYDDGTFRPSAPVLREQMAAFLYRLAGEPDFTPPATSPFADVPKTHTFYREITWLADQGVTTGYAEANGTTTFRGSQPVLREQMAAFLFRFVDIPAER